MQHIEYASPLGTKLETFTRMTNAIAEYLQSTDCSESVTHVANFGTFPNGSYAQVR